jgi:hypothetical protein
MKTLFNNDKSKKALINRSLLSDGYNYYITILIYCKY